MLLLKCKTASKIIAHMKNQNDNRVIFNERCITTMYFFNRTHKN